jgi:hypothetical protein
MHDVWLLPQFAAMLAYPKLGSPVWLIGVVEVDGAKAVEKHFL